jgi:hypothetical protein
MFSALTLFACLISRHPVRFAGSAESAAIQQCFSLTTNQRTVFSATMNQRNEQGAYFFSERTMFFSHNKSANITFSYGLSAKRTEPSCFVHQ